MNDNQQFPPPPPPSQQGAVPPPVTQPAPPPASAEPFQGSGNSKKRRWPIVLAVLVMASAGMGVAWSVFDKGSDLGEAEKLCDEFIVDFDSFFFKRALMFMTGSISNFVNDPTDREVFDLLNDLNQGGQKMSAFLKELGDLSLGDDWPDKESLREAGSVLEEMVSFTEALSSALDRYDGTNLEELVPLFQELELEGASIQERFDAIDLDFSGISEPETCRIVLLEM